MVRTMMKGVKPLKDYSIVCKSGSTLFRLEFIANMRNLLKILYADFVLKKKPRKKDSS